MSQGSSASGASGARFPRKSGYFMKQGGSYKSWKRRWFVLEECEIRYFKDDSKKTLKGTISLDAATKCEVHADVGDYKNVLALETPGRTYIFSFDSREVLASWMLAIRRYLSARSHIDEEDDIAPVVFDIGSCFIRSGFSGEPDPRAILPVLVCGSTDDGSFRFVEDDDLRKKDETIRKMVNDGEVLNWGDLRSAVSIGYEKDLNVTAELHPVLISVNPIASREQLDTIQHLFLSNLRVPKIELVPDAVLTLVASGHDTGIVVDIGECSTRISCVHNLRYLPYASKSIPIGGKHVTEMLRVYLNEHFSSYDPSVTGKPYPCDQRIMTSDDFDVRVLRDIKKRLLQVASKSLSQSPSEASRTFPPMLYSLPPPASEQLVVDSVSRWKPCETLFENQMMLSSLEDVIQALPTIGEVRFEVASRLVLSGGTSQLKGMRERFREELVGVKPLSEIEILVAPRNSVWLGGSVFASCIDAFICKDSTPSPSSMSFLFVPNS